MYVSTRLPYPTSHSTLHSRSPVSLYSTLILADRAKQIKTKAVINEDPTETLLRELREENERLKQALEGGTVDIKEIPVETKGLSDKGKIINSYKNESIPS